MALTNDHVATTIDHRVHALPERGRHAGRFDDDVSTSPVGEILDQADSVGRVRNLVDFQDLRSSQLRARSRRAAGPPTTMTSMRHSTLSTTTEVYGHLLRHVAQQAVDAIDTALTAAENATKPA